MNQYRFCWSVLLWCCVFSLEKVSCQNRTTTASVEEEYDPDYDDPKWQRATSISQSESLKSVNSVRNDSSDSWLSVINENDENGLKKGNTTSEEIETKESCMICTEWLPINHVYFQLANTFLLLSYLSKNSVCGLLYLRLTLAIGSFFFTLWAMAILCVFDTFLWNAVFTVINVVHLVIILFSLRPVHIIPELIQVYKTMFEPLKISRQQFRKVVDCMKIIRHLRYQESFAREGETQVDTLSLLLEGKCVASQQGRVLHVIHANQFVDSAEWFGVLSDTCSQVTVTALEESKVLMWQKDKLKLTLASDAHLQAVFNHILGQDVVQKLIMAHGVLSLNGNLPNERQPVDKHLVLNKENLSLIALLQQTPTNKGTDKETSFLLNDSMCKNSVNIGDSSVKSKWSSKSSEA